MADRNKRSDWKGLIPLACNLCGMVIQDDQTFIDGKTVMGPWAIMCTPCHAERGHGLGTGKGQSYEP